MAATIVKGDKSFILALGPLKVEVMLVSGAVDNDTITSKLAAPSAAVIFPAGDASGASNVSASVSGKTITIHDPVASVDHIVLVFGDALWV